MMESLLFLKSPPGVYSLQALVRLFFVPNEITEDKSRRGRVRATGRGTPSNPGPRPAWLRPQQEAVSSSQASKNLAWVSGHAARGKQVGGGQSRARPLGAHGTAGICEVVVFSGTDSSCLAALACLLHF